MIRFALICAREHAFEAWFRSNADFDRLREQSAIACPTCGGHDVRKAIMAPAVSRGAPPAQSETPGPQKAAAGQQQAVGELLRLMRAVHEHVHKTFENVGARFPDEARQMHLGESEKRNIFGEATAEEVRDLLEEGIAVRPLPPLPKLDG